MNIFKNNLDKPLSKAQKEFLTAYSELQEVQEKNRQHMFDIYKKEFFENSPELNQEYDKLGEEYQRISQSIQDDISKEGLT